MTRSVALKLQSDSAVAVVARPSGRTLAIEAAIRVPLNDADDPRTIGRKLAAALAPCNVNRAPAVVAVPRNELFWQTIDLPPAPLNDLPDLVHLQIQRDLPVGDDGAGFDFLSLRGDDEHPHQVLGVGMSPAALDRIRRICAAADLKLEHVVPEPFGWVALGRRIELPAAAHALTVYCSIAGRQAVVWASESDSLRLLRTTWLPGDADPTADASALAAELRRTLLSLTQGPSAASAPLSNVYCGENAEEVAAELSGALSRPVRSVGLADLAAAPANAADFESLGEIAPLAALAAATVQREPVLLDLLHPHRPPEPPSRTRTYVLAGVAAAALAALLAWTAYRNVQTPLEAAAAADAERKGMTAELARLAEDEKKVAAIEQWFGESVNLLAEIDYLGQQLRPQAIGTPDFNSDEDVVVTKLTVTGRQLAVNAAARSTEAVAPAEARLRQAGYVVDRGAVDPETNPVPGYAVSVSALLQREAATAQPPEVAP